MKEKGLGEVFYNPFLYGLKVTKLILCQIYDKIYLSIKDAEAGETFF